jgi:hypothetical protein
MSRMPRPQPPLRFIILLALVGWAAPSVAAAQTEPPPAGSAPASEAAPPPASSPVEPLPSAEAQASGSVTAGATVQTAPPSFDPAANPELSQQAALGVEPRPAKPFYKRAWFWGAIGVVALTTVIIVVAASSGGPDEPDTVLGNMHAF